MTPARAHLKLMEAARAAGKVTTREAKLRAVPTIVTAGRPGGGKVDRAWSAELDAKLDALDDGTRTCIQIADAAGVSKSTAQRRLVPLRYRRRLRAAA